VIVLGCLISPPPGPWLPATDTDTQAGGESPWANGAAGPNRDSHLVASGLSLMTRLLGWMKIGSPGLPTSRA